MRTSGMTVATAAVLLLVAVGCPESKTPADPAPAASDSEIRDALEIGESPLPEPLRLELPPRPETPVPRPLVDEQDARIEVAMALRHTPRAEEGIALLGKVRADALAQQQPKVAAWALHRLGDCRGSLGRKEVARQAYEEALAEHQANGDLALAGRAANDLGLLSDRGTASSRSEMALSARWYAQATELYQRSGDEHGLRLALNNQARMHLWRANFGPAVEIWNSAAILARRLGDAESERRIHANLALAWLLLAEGGFGKRADEVVDPEAEAMAREHFLLAREAARLAGESTHSICEAWGGWRNRCNRITSALPRPPLEAGPPDPSRIRGRVIEGLHEVAASRVEAYREAAPFSLTGLACAEGSPPTHEDIEACACGEERAELARRIRAVRPGLLKTSAPILADGSFVLEGLVPGERYRLVASGARWRGELPEVEAGAQQIELGALRHREVEGQVLDPKGTPLSGATVLLADLDRGNWVQVRTDAEGRFSLDMAFTRVLALTAGPGDQVAFSISEPHRVVALRRYPPEPHILSASPLREIDLEVRTRKGPLGRLPITAESGGCSLKISTGSDGRVRLALPGDSIHLVAETETHYLDRWVDLPRTPRRAKLRVGATSYALIRGLVVDGQDQPLAGLKLHNRVKKAQVWSHGGGPYRWPFPAFLTTDGEGRFLARYRDADTYCFYPEDLPWALANNEPVCRKIAEGETLELKLVARKWRPRPTTAESHNPPSPRQGEVHQGHP